MSKVDELKEVINQLPDLPGVYIYRNSVKKVIYVGKAINLKKRVKSYFISPTRLGPKTNALVSNIVSIDHIVVQSEIEALLLEAELIKRYKPRYNIVLKDDKSHLYIKITTNEQVPRISTVRRENLKGVTYFGPYPSALTAKSVLKTIRKLFPYRSCKTLPKAPCLFYHLKLCSAPCAVITPQEYRKTVKQIVLFLSGKRKQVIRDLEKELNLFSENLQYEEASKIKQKIDDIKYITTQFTRPKDYIENPNLLEDQRQQTLKELYDYISPYLEISKPPNRIECYDISNIQGTNAVGAMVVATSAAIDKSQYRKFKIRTKDTPDDFHMLSEVLKRRLNNDWATPDLIVIDGGKGQLQAALNVLNSTDSNIPTISLAKRLEEIFIKKDDQFISIVLPRNSKSLQLLQQLRDEAHRFGITFHRNIRSKKMFENK